MATVTSKCYGATLFDAARALCFCTSPVLVSLGFMLLDRNQQQKRFAF